MSLDKMSVPELLEQAIHFYSHNSSFVNPGVYDIEGIDVAWIFTVCFMIFTMMIGMALTEVGVCREKNVVNVLMRNFVDLCAGGVVFWVIGFGLMYGRGEYTNAFFGFGDFMMNEPLSDPMSGQLLLLLFLQMSYATSATTIAAGAVAERFRIKPYIIYSFMLTLVYNVGGGWVWGQHGWLKNIGVIDFSGAGPIHIIGGSAAFVSAWFMGPRIGRYDIGIEPLPLTDPIMSILGLLIVWWGWIAFNAGSSYGIANGKWELAARAGAGTVLATMAAGVTSIFFSLYKHNRKIDVAEILTGIMASLVAINAGCHLFSMPSSFITGVVAALLCLLAGPIVDRMRIDDAVGATACHLVNGIWGQISVGIFADPPNGPKGLFIDGSTYQLKVQAISAFSLMIWSGMTSFLIIWSVNKISPIRFDEEEELKGTDIEYTQPLEGFRCSQATLPVSKKNANMMKVFDDTPPAYEGLTHRKPFDNFLEHRPSITDIANIINRHRASIAGPYITHRASICGPCVCRQRTISGTFTKDQDNLSFEDNEKLE